MSDSPILRIGPATTSDGVTQLARGDRQGNTVMTAAHGDYNEPCSRGSVYYVSVPIAQALS